MKTYNRIPSTNGTAPRIIPKKSRWGLAGWVALLTCWTIAVFLMGHWSGYYYSENRLEEKTGIKIQEWKGIEDDYQKRLKEIKEKRNGLRK